MQDSRSVRESARVVAVSYLAGTLLHGPPIASLSQVPHFRGEGKVSVLSASCADQVSHQWKGARVAADAYLGMPCCAGLPSSLCHPGEGVGSGPERVVGTTAPLRLRGTGGVVSGEACGWCIRVPRRGLPITSSSWRGEGVCPERIVRGRCRGRWEAHVRWQSCCTGLPSPRRRRGEGVGLGPEPSCAGCVTVSGTSKHQKRISKNNEKRE